MDVRYPVLIRFPIIAQRSKGGALLSWSCWSSGSMYVSGFTLTDIGSVSCRLQTVTLLTFTNTTAATMLTSQTRGSGAVGACTPGLEY